MKRFLFVVRILIIPLVMVLYVGILFRNLNEGARRSLQLQKDVATADKVHILINIVKADLNNEEVTARLRFRVAGKIAENEITPSVNLRFLVGFIRGQQEFVFRRGQRMTPIEGEFSLDGVSNRYPFDAHQTTLAFLVTKPGRAERPVSAAAPAASAIPLKSLVKSKKQKANPAKQAVPAPAAASPVVVGTTLAGTAALERNDPVPISYNLTASIPGIKFRGETLKGAHEEVTEIQLRMTRADNVIVVSMIIMVMMMCLAMSLLAMVLYSMVGGKESTLLPLSLSVSLIFGLPALRNAQPNVPPLGAFSDYLSFLWAEFIVAASTVIVVWRWILSSRREKTTENSEAPKDKS
ncbi:MAG: DUF4436 domain-containing protein [Acidobacteriia bacterium]|nr:DUF4436 domain-containing protein [Terriglobia bacterium]